MTKLEDIQARHLKATPGPYMWDVHTAARVARLMTTHSGAYYVLQFKRWGTQSAMPMFQKFEKYQGPVKERCSMGMRPVTDFAKPRMDHHPDFDMWVDHPDAIAMEKSWEDIEFLLQLNLEMQCALEFAAGWLEASLKANGIGRAPLDMINQALAKATNTD